MSHVIAAVSTGAQVSAIGILVFYSITEWIMSHKLNLD